MKHKELTFLGTMVLAALLIVQGCADQGKNNGMGSPLITGYELDAPETAAGTDEPVSKAAQSSSGYDFIFEVRIQTSIIAIDAESGAMVVDYNPKSVKIDNDTYIFAKGDIAAKYDTGEFGTENANSSTTLKLSVSDLSAGDGIILYADAVGSSEFYAVAVERIAGTSGPVSLAN